MERLPSAPPVDPLQSASGIPPFPHVNIVIRREASRPRLSAADRQPAAAWTEETRRRSRGASHPSPIRSRHSAALPVNTLHASAGHDEPHAVWFRTNVVKSTSLQRGSIPIKSCVEHPPAPADDVATAGSLLPSRPARPAHCRSSAASMCAPLMCVLAVAEK